MRKFSNILTTVLMVLAVVLLAGMSITLIRNNNTTPAPPIDSSEIVDSKDDEPMEVVPVLEALYENKEHIVINLIEDETIVPTCKASSVWGGENTKTITVNGNGKALVLDNKYDCVVQATAGAKLIFNDVTIKSVRNESGTWNIHNIYFKNEAEFNNVYIGQEIALAATGKTMKLNNVIIHAALYDLYAIWVEAGTHLEMDNCTIISAKGRAIKVSDEYVTGAKASNLSIKNTMFSSVKKAAILIGNSAGANIALENVNIVNVVADNQCPVWVDSDYQDYIDKVQVAGGSLRYEG